jgi:hypothetical protein
MIAKIIRPALGAKRVPDVEQDDIAALHRGMKKTPYRANRVLALASQLRQDPGALPVYRLSVPAITEVCRRFSRRPRCRCALGCAKDLFPLCASLGDFWATRGCRQQGYSARPIPGNQVDNINSNRRSGMRQPGRSISA